MWLRGIGDESGFYNERQVSQLKCNHDDMQLTLLAQFSSQQSSSSLLGWSDEHSIIEFMAELILKNDA